jgi:hypothetical protein
MIESLSCVCGVESWLFSSISPLPGPEFNFLNPLHQGRFPHQTATAETEGRKAGNARHFPEKQVAKMGFAAPKYLRAFASRQHFRKYGQRRKVRI